MSYSLRIERIGSCGTPLGSPVIETASSELDALGLMRRAVERARPLPQPMQFSIFGPNNRLLVNYTSGTRDRDPAVAASA